MCIANADCMHSMLCLHVQVDMITGLKMVIEESQAHFPIRAKFVRMGALIKEAW